MFGKGFGCWKQGFEEREGKSGAGIRVETSTRHQVRKSAMKNGDGVVDPVHSQQGWAGIRVETSTRHQVKKSAMKNGDGVVRDASTC